MSKKGRKAGSARHYPRTARLNELLQRIVADEFERMDDPDLGFLTVTGVEVDNDLNLAEVFVTAFGIGEGDVTADEAFLDHLNDSYRIRIQRAIANEARLRKTPHVEFKLDGAVRSGARVEQILRDLGVSSEIPEGEGPDSVSDEPDDGILEVD